MSGQNEIFGVGTENAQLILGGAVGAGLRIYLRPAGRLVRNVATGVLCIGAASVFGHDVQAWLPLNMAAAGGVVALGCLGVAEGILRAVERVDFLSLLKREKS